MMRISFKANADGSFRGEVEFEYLATYILENAIAAIKEKKRPKVEKIDI